MVSIYLAGTYKPIMCGIADYAYYIVRRCPAGRWGVLSFDLQKYGDPLTGDKVATEHVWYGIPGRYGFSAAVIREGLRQLGAGDKNSVVWFQHEYGIWRDDQRFITMLKELPVAKVVSLHTLHFQSTETPSGLRSSSCHFLRELLPYVDAITVFSRGVYNAVSVAFPEYRDKVHILRHGVHSYPEIRRLSRKEAKEKLSDYLLYESDLDRETREAIHKQRIFVDLNTVVVGQTGFLSHAKNSESLFAAQDDLQKLLPDRRVIVMRVGSPREEPQKLYAEKLQALQNYREKFFMINWLPEDMFPIAHRAFDVNFYWPSDCTQSGVMSHALGAGAAIASRDMEGVGENLRDAGELVDASLEKLQLKIKELIHNPEIEERIQETALAYATENSWENQVRRHYELAEPIIPREPHPPITVSAVVK